MDSCRYATLLHCSKGVHSIFWHRNSLQLSFPIPENTEDQYKLAHHVAVQEMYQEAQPNFWKPWLTYATLFQLPPTRIPPFCLTVAYKALRMSYAIVQIAYFPTCSIAEKSIFFLFSWIKFLVSFCVLFNQHSTILQQVGLCLSKNLAYVL